MKVIIDAANVAHFQKEEGSKAKLKNITLAVKALEQGNHDFLIIADASLRHNIDDKETFVRLVNDGIIDEVPQKAKTVLGTCAVKKSSEVK